MMLIPRPAPIYSSLLLAAMLTLMPMPEAVGTARPLWLPMTVLFWNLTEPGGFNIGSAWLVGILLDLISGSLLGQHALAMALMSFIAIRFHKQYRLYSVLQRLLSIGSALLIWQIVVTLVWGLDGQRLGPGAFTLPLLTSLVLWPWYSGVLGWANEHWRKSKQNR